MFWGKQRSASSPSRLYCSSLFCECPKFCDLAKQRRKIFGGVSEVGKDDFSLYFFWRCVVFLVFYFSSRRANVSAGQAAKRAESIKDAVHRAIGESPGGAGPAQPFVTELKFKIGQLQSQFRDLNQEIGQKVNEFVDLVSDVKKDTCNRSDDFDGKLARH